MGELVYSMNEQWIVFLGPPGCGKGTHSAYLAERFGFATINVGDLLRANTDKLVYGMGRTVGELLSNGSLLPDDAVMSFVIEKIVGTHGSGTKVLFDGFPRTLVQVGSLRDVSLKFGTVLSKVINFSIDDDVLVKRVLGRYRCLNCGKVYNEFFLKPSRDGVCDVCGCSEFDRRSDDNEASLKKRLSEYHTKTYPLIDFYLECGILYDIDASRSIEEVRNSVLEVLR